MKNHRYTAMKENNRASCRSVYCLLVVICLSLLLLSQVSTAGVAVIISPDSDLKTLQRSQVKAIFLGKIKRLPNGDIAIPVNQGEKSGSFDAFNEKLLGKSSAKLLQFWATRIFSGKGMPPKILKGDQAVIDFVKSVKGGIGYIDSGSVSAEIKVIYSAD